MTLTNQERASRFADTITHYADDEPSTNFRDCLADAMHWCHLNGHRFEDALKIAQAHFEAELFESASLGSST